jgi:hypothetical protein
MNRQIRLTVILVTTAFLLTSCDLSRVKDKPVTFITEKPINIDTAEYKKIIEDFNIETVQNVPDYYGGLSPKFEMAEVSKHSIECSDCLNRNNLNEINEMCEYCIDLIVKKDGQYIHVKSDNDLKKLFAPIDNEEEAISYVSIVTGTYPMYNFEQLKNMKYLVSNFNRTYASRQKEGFETVTFDYDIFCCPPHNYNLTRCFVDFDGNVKLLERYAVGINLSDGLCND